MGLSVTAVRRAEPGDLAAVQGVEADADLAFGAVLDVSGWPAPPTGAERAARGTVLVIGQPVVGFAHVVELDGSHHLDALAVRRDNQGRGLGTSLLRAAYGVVLDAGGDRLTLTTFAGVPWNAPWYAREGFRPVAEPLAPDLAAVRDAERAAGLDRCGARLAMGRTVADTPEPIPAVSVIPVRDGQRGLEVFVQHRVATMDFVPNAVVFPGGRVDAGDIALGAALELDRDVLALHEQAWARTHPERFDAAMYAARTILATGLREVEEETGARIDAADLIPWDNWVTPIGGQKRFDVRFLLLPVRTRAFAESFTHATTESHRSEWTPVAGVAAGAEDGSLVLVAPTRVLVEELTRLDTVEDAVALRPVITPVHHDICPSPAVRGRPFVGTGR